MTDPDVFHEDLTREHDVAQASPRSFGVLFFIVFMMVGLAPLFGAAGVRWWSVLLAVAVGSLALLAPHVLAPLNALWMKLGAILHLIVSPIVMALLFVGAILPTGVMLRLFGRDNLGLRRDSSKATYWIERTPPGPESESLRQQF